MPVLLANLIAEHGMRHPRKSVLSGGQRVDLDDLERAAEALPQRVETLARQCWVLGEVSNDFPPRRGAIQSYLKELVDHLVKAGTHTR